jgi:hypothetical protein
MSNISNMYFNGDGSPWSPDQNKDLDTICSILDKENIIYEPMDDYPSSMVIIPSKILLLSFVKNDVIVTKGDPNAFIELGLSSSLLYDIEAYFFEEFPEPSFTKSYSSIDERNADLITLINSI